MPADTPVPAPPPAPRNSWRRRLSAWLWGYDYFVSYHWASGGVYAIALAQQLRDRGYDVFLDRAEYAGGDDWMKVGERALRRTQRLVLVATREAVVGSKPVAREVSVFTSRGRQVIPIVFAEHTDGVKRSTLADLDRTQYPVLALLPDSVLHLEDDVTRLSYGPSPEVVERLLHTYGVMRKRDIRALLLGLLAAIVIVFAAFATTSWGNALLRQSEAELAADREAKARTRAEQERGRAQASEQRAVQRAKESESRRLALLSNNLARDRRLDVALLVASHALRTSPTPEAREALLNRLVAAPPLRAFLPGHTRPVSALASGTKGRRVASGDWDGVVFVWTLQGFSSESVHKLQLSDRATALAFGLGDSRLAVSSESGELRMYDLTPADPKLLWSVQATSKQQDRPGTGLFNPFAPLNLPPKLLCVAFRPDGQVVASGDDRGNIRFWDTETGRPRAGPKKWTFLLKDLLPDLGEKAELEVGGVYSLEYTPDGNVLVASGGGVVVLFDPLTGRGAPLEAPGFQFGAAAVAPGAKTLAYSVSRKVDDQTTESRIVLASVDKGVPTGKCRSFAGDGWSFGGAAFSPDGKTLAVGGGQGVVELWDLTGMNPERRARLEGHSADPVRVAFSPDGTRLVSAGWDGRVILWDTNGLPDRLGEAVLSTRLPASNSLGLDFVVTSSVGPTVVAASKLSNEVWFFPPDKLPEQPARPATFRVSHGVNCMVTSPDGQVVAVNDGGGNLRLIDVKSRQQREQWPNGADKLFGRCMVFSPRADRLLVAESSRLVLFDVATGDSQVLKIPIASFNPTALAFDREGARMAVGDGSTVYVWNDVDSTPLKYPPGNVLPPITIKIILFQPGGGLLGIGMPANGVAAWDLLKDTRSDESVQVAGTHSPSDVAISEDGTMLVGSFGNVIQLWDFARKQPWGPPLGGHGASANMLALLSGGKRVVSASHAPWVQRQTAERTTTSTILEKQCLYLWDIDPKSWLDLVHALVNRPMSPEERRAFDIIQDD